MSRVLVIGGTDSSGGAGIQADLRALAHLGLDAAVVVTAVTAQTMMKVLAVHPVPRELVEAQLRAAVDEPVDAVKIGLLPSVGVVEVVGRFLEDRDVPIVADPVRHASSGSALAEGTDDDWRRLVLPHATVVTPNAPELADLTGAPVEDLDGLRRAAVALAVEGPAWVLATGGHLDTAAAVDLLTDGRQTSELTGPRVDLEVRGTGCTLASLLAACLATQEDVPKAAQAAKRHLAAMFETAVVTQSGLGRFSLP
ncbi:MAG: hydroxymethylpyrimidine/phosphomethylpyrimidine kinase [Nitriliruptorales bacterium]|nr:hydroxymethylpyrimidine/phosphomethylpyrimidine kinase [Nitriliruptorales bacterium]